MYSAEKIKSTYSTHNRVSLIKGGSPYFNALFEIIDNAQKSFQLQVYIYEEDHTGLEVATHLMNAADRGVKVQLLLDGYASSGLSSGFRKKIKNKGIQLRFFEPLLKSEKFYFGRRLHHKIAVADGTIALVGGINISDRYNDVPGQSAWLDWAIRVEGEAAFELYTICNQFYDKKTNDLIELDRNSIMNSLDTNTNFPVRIRRNDWVKNLNEISASYMEMFKNAENDIIIMSSYFIPGSFFKKNIIKALNRGVNIKLILAGMSDLGIAKYAEKYLYRWAIRHGIEIYEYKHNVLHGKIAVSDKKFVTAGSYNINDISALASVELNLDIQENEFATHVYNTLREIIKDECVRISPIKVIRSYSMYDRWMQWISYESFRLVFTLFTFYFRRNKKKLLKV